MIEIRKVEKEDLTSLTVLFEQYRVFYENVSDEENAKKFISERLSNNDSVIYVAENAIDKIIGFVQLYPTFSSTRMKRLWLLNDLFVAKKYRGNGISKQLINASKELCEQTDACGLLLETAKTNTVGNSLYKNTGFLLDKEHNYYSWDR